MYSRHQELKQASKQASKPAPQPIHELLVATEAVGEFFIFEESVCAPRVRVRPSVVLVLERVLPAIPGPLVAQEADEGRTLDEVGGGDSTEQAVEDREALGGPRPPRWAPVTIATWPPKVSPAPLLVLHVGLLFGRGSAHSAFGAGA